MSGRKLTPEEARAWSRVTRSIHPIGETSEDFEHLLEALDSPDSKAPEPIKEKTVRKVPNQTVWNTPKKIDSTPAPIPDRGRERRVKRGKIEISATFDLHGHTQASAARVLPAFLMREQAEGARCVLIITGKGRGGEGVLRRRFLDWLETAAARPIVSGYSEAHARHGGSGAFYVFLRRTG